MCLWKRAITTQLFISAFSIQKIKCLSNKGNLLKRDGRIYGTLPAGSVLKGETSQQGAHRELLEEVGIDYDFTDIRPNFTINFYDGFDDFYLIEKDIDICGLKLQYEEVQAVKWASLEEIFQMIEEGMFIPYFRSLITAAFETKGQHDGCIRT